MVCPRRFVVCAFGVKRPQCSSVKGREVYHEMLYPDLVNALALCHSGKQSLIIVRVQPCYLAMLLLQTGTDTAFAQQPLYHLVLPGVLPGHLLHQSSLTL